MNQLHISMILNGEKSYVIFRESNDKLTSCNCSSVIFPKWGLWCTISIFRSSGPVILNSAENFFGPRHVQRTAPSRHIWKLPILAGWHVLRKLRHMKKVPCKKFIIIIRRKQLVYAPKWSWNQQLSAKYSKGQQSTKFSTTIDNIKLRTFSSSNSIGPENFLQFQLVPKTCVHKIEILHLTRLHDKISTWLHCAGFPLYVVFHVSETPLKP